MAGVFKAYDVRGIYGPVLNAELGYRIGRCFGARLGAGKSLVTGRDGRHHSPQLQDALIEGLLDAGVHVCQMGLCTTPMNYFAGYSASFDASVMVTASHNGGAYNGLKFCRERAIPIGYDDGLQEIEAEVQGELPAKAAERGSLSAGDFAEAYLSFLTGMCRVRKNFRFAVDCGNGMGGHLITRLLDRLGQQAVPLFWDLDFSFPNHPANPLDFSTLATLQTVVLNQGLNFGVAFDGDADRCFFVDERGAIIPADLLTAALACDFLEEHGPSAVVYDVRSSRVVAEEILKRGGEPVMCRVGHSYMKAMLRQKNGWFGGELAGHFYFREFSFADSAFLTMIKIMNLLEKTGKSLGQLIEPFRKYSPSGEINFVTDKGDELIALAPQRFPGGTICAIDGIRLDYQDWWFCLRKSNTEPLLRLVIEAQSPARLTEVRQQVEQWILQSGAKLHEGGH